jgi:hypothetical protein
MKWRKGAKKGRQREQKTGTFIVAFFSALFGFLFFSSDFIQYRMLDLDFFGFAPFLYVEIEKGEKKERKREEKRLL